MTQSLSHNDITHASKWKDIAAFVADNAHPLNLLISPLCFHPDLPLLITASDVFPILRHSFILMFFPILIWNVSLWYTFVPSVMPQWDLHVHVPLSHLMCFIQLTFTPCDVLPLMFLYHNWQQDIPLSHLMSPSEMDSENPGLFTSWISWSVKKKNIKSSKIILIQARHFNQK